MKTSKMPPGLRRYWQKHGSKLGGLKRARKTKKDAARGRAKTRRFDKRTTHHVARCSHANARPVLSGAYFADGTRVARITWCSSCGGLFDGERWHRVHG
jgi:hypothetical protein